MKYKTILNKLTVPHSFYPLAIINKTNGIDDVASLIHDKVSNIPVDIARDAINEMVFVIKDELQNGNWVNFTKFLSLRTKMFGSMESSTDYHYNIKVIVIIAKEFQIKTKKKVVLKKGTSDELIPVIFNVKDTESGMNNFLQYGYGVEIYGENLKINMSASDEGVLIRYPSGTEVLQGNIIMNSPKKLISGVSTDPAYGGGPGGQNNVEHFISVKNRNGSVNMKTAFYGEPIRAVNNVNSVANKILITANTSAPAELLYSGFASCILKAKILSGKILMSAIYNGAEGNTVYVSGNETVVIDGLPNELECTIIDFDKLYNNIKRNGGLLMELCNLSFPVVPVILYSETFDGFNLPLPAGWSAILSDPTEVNTRGKIYFDKLYIYTNSNGSVQSSEVTNGAFLFPTDQDWEFTMNLRLRFEDVSSGTARIEVLLGNDFTMQFRCWSNPQAGDIRLVIDGSEEISPTPFVWSGTGYTSFDLKLSNNNNDLAISYDTGTGYNWLGGTPKVVEDFFSKYVAGTQLTNKINVYSSRTNQQIAQVQGDNYLVMG